MGYYVSGNGTFRIAPEREADALAALHALNWRNDLKRGGRWPRTPDAPENEPREDIWFAWMPWNYHETTDSVDAVLEAVGFTFTTADDGTRAVSYDDKMGCEDVFLDALGPFVDAGGEMTWTGEDSTHWRCRFDGTQTVWENGMVVFVPAT